MERTSAPTARVVIIEGEPGVRRGLCIRLAAEPDLAVVGAAADVPRGVDLVRQLRPELVLLDAGLAVGDGSTATRLLRSARADLPIVVLGLHDDAATRAAALEAGATAFVSKHDGDAALLATIRRFCSAVLR